MRVSKVDLVITVLALYHGCAGTDGLECFNTNTNTLIKDVITKKDTKECSACLIAKSLSSPDGTVLQFCLTEPFNDNKQVVDFLGGDATIPVLAANQCQMVNDMENVAACVCKTDKCNKEDFDFGAIDELFCWEDDAKSVLSPGEPRIVMKESGEDSPCKACGKTTCGDDQVWHKCLDETMLKDYFEAANKTYDSSLTESFSEEIHGGSGCRVDVCYDKLCNADGGCAGLSGVATAAIVAAALAKWMLH